MTDSLRDELQALASELSAEGLPSIARRIDAILDAEQDETADPEGQPEGSEPRACACEVTITKPRKDRCAFGRPHAYSLGWLCQTCHGWIYDRLRCSECGQVEYEPNPAPAPVPDDEVESAARLIASIWYGTDWEDVDPEDAAICIREGRTMLMELHALGYISSEAHAAAVREAVRAELDDCDTEAIRRNAKHREIVVAAVDAALAEAEQAILAQTDADLGCPCQCSRGQRDHAAQIVRALREGQR